MIDDVVLAGIARTPIGSLCGALADMSAASLGAAAIKASVDRAEIVPDAVDEVIFGNVISAGQGQNIARQAAIGAGLPTSVGATTVNKVCGSGLKAVMLAVQAIRCGDAEVIVAGGTESMSNAPYLLLKARTGYRMGHGQLIDSMIQDGLWDVYSNVHMGICGDRCAERYAFSRQDLDDFAVASYERANRAAEQGHFNDEIVAVEVAGRKEPSIVDRDEEPARFNEQKLRQLRPAFGKDGTVTAGNASSVNDGAAAVAVVGAKKAASLGIVPQARIVGYSAFSREPEWFTLAPIGAIGRLLEQVGWRIDDVDLFEINEAFSAVPLAAMKELGIAHDKLNVNGGAVALGHPIGASGARVLVTLVAALRQRGARRGIASLCIGGGEAVATAVEIA